MGCGCGCAPAFTPRQELALAADPSLRKLLGCRRVPVEAQTIGGILPAVVWPSDVDKLKKRIDPQMVATDTGVAACAALEPGERSAWKAFYAAWRVFYATPVPFLFGSSNDWDDATAFELQLAGWQEELRKKCPIPGPVVKPPEGLDLSALKWASAAVIAVAGVYAVTRIL